ncbi:DUF4145 domain-containing protein [Embleya sp. NPDC008237]|uniref:DUF4145 domain-containing protein n=1 Tax=Embleya sp. NPDC008237 TaxID=3363978 RepID=UPI0036E07241
MTFDDRADPIVTFCATCDKTVFTDVCGAVLDRNDAHGPPSLTTLVRCTSCGSAVLVVQEDIGDGWDEPYRLWPSERKTLSRLVPDGLRQELTEAQRCFEAKAFTAVVVMVRRTLEGVCAEQGISDKRQPLYKSLKELQEAKKIDGQLVEWANALRVLGNEGAHYTGHRMTREDARDALAFAEALVDYMYELTAQFAAFKSRREQSASTGSEA